MELPEVVSTLQQAAPGARVEEARAADGASTLYVDPADLGSVLVTLRDHPSLAFTLFELTAIDYLPREPRFELVYQLVSIALKTRLRVKVRVPGTDPHVATASSIWPSANWLEREVWDLFGIAFDGHPDPRRLLMPEDWEGFPLRKDFPVQIRMTPKTGEAIQVTAEEFRENLQRDRLSRQQ